MEKVSYKEQLADGRWLKRKNEILERDNYTCQQCGATFHLNVHHKLYLKDRKAWEYPSEILITLCERCHNIEHCSYKPYVGQVYSYDHGDFTNYLICYGVNSRKNEGYFFGFDNGGSWHNTIFELITFDDFAQKCVNERAFFESTTMQENHWQELLVDCLIRLYLNNDRDFETAGFPYDKGKVYDYAQTKLCNLLNSNSVLSEEFNRKLNQW